MKYLLIGAGPGNGLALARQFGKAGFEVLMVARNLDKLKQYEADLAAEGIRATGFAADLADPHAFEAFLRDLAAVHKVQVVHYNASAYNPGAPTTLDTDTFVRDLHTNVTGAFLLAKVFVPVLQHFKMTAFFLTGGGSALHPSSAVSSLSLGKAAMRSLAFSLAEECAPLGIHVATVTINGMVKPGTSLDPELIAAEFWRLYLQRQDEWETEVVLD